MAVDFLDFNQVYEFNNPLTSSANKIIAVPPGAKFVSMQLIPEGAPSAVNATVYQSLDGLAASASPIPGVGSTAIAGAVTNSTGPTAARFLHIFALSRTGGTNTKVLVSIAKLG